MKIKYVILPFIKLGKSMPESTKKLKLLEKWLRLFFKFSEQLQGFTSAAFTSSFKQDL